MTKPDHTASGQDAPASYEPGEPVALFLPCYIDQLYPRIGRAVVALLERLSIPVEYPEDQTCCGQPAFNTGYWDEARQVVHHFVRVFARYRWIVVPSGSCATMARVFFGQLDPAPAILETGGGV